ncbi:MAG: sn-glycerol-3-phosphate ABC transporter ATP-binding protein UgpC [Desulfobacteraceae bacterium]|nr:MAG: sn-glycerol-3-phosphate ABC transporter ATP-binding protein UgpC [Desulfobacteraceae bacterium]
MNGAHIRIVNIRKNFGKVCVIEGVNCDIRESEFIVILGPSGCGKSTLLRIIAGLETATEGEIYIGGKIMNQVEPKDRNIAMVFQNYALYPHMTVWNNMAYGLKDRKMPKTEIEARVKKAADILGLDGLMQRTPRQLSGGQRQRVAMGRAIVRNPAAFLFDEPLSNLDAKLRVQMRLEIKKLHQSVRTTSIYVTHDQVEAMTLADRLIVMNAGKFDHVGTPMDVYERPATLFVAGFIGSPAMNIIPMELSSEEDAVKIPGGSWLPLAGRLMNARNKSVMVGMRPEHITLAQGEMESFQIPVEFVEVLGADTLVHGPLNGESQLTIRLPGSFKVSEGDKLKLRIRPEDLHMFDSRTGLRLMTHSNPNRRLHGQML